VEELRVRNTCGYGFADLAVELDELAAFVLALGVFLGGPAHEGEQDAAHDEDERDHEQHHHGEDDRSTHDLTIFQLAAALAPKAPPRMPAKKSSAEAEPAPPVGRSTISSPERSEASEGEGLIP